MIYSFTNPKKRTIFSFFFKIWAWGFALSFAVISVIYGYYFFENNDRNSLILELRKLTNEVNNETQKSEELFKNSLNKSHIAQKIKHQNQATIQVIKNIFSLIDKSNGLVFESLKQGQNSLEIIGLTPTKEKFILLLDTRLKSVFKTSKIQYKRLKNGTYRFIAKYNLGEKNER